MTVKAHEPGSWWNAGCFLPRFSQGTETFTVGLNATSADHRLKIDGKGRCQKGRVGPVGDKISSPCSPH
jgi:hypothetical protein